ncbi:v-type proton ATPase 16 kDa proteolipid subunit 2 [Saitoella coloradoensis]
MSLSAQCPAYAPFFGFSGVAAAMIFSCGSPPIFLSHPPPPEAKGSMGAAYGTAKAGIGIAGMGTFKPELIMKSLIPVVMSGIIAVYGLVIAVLIAGELTPTEPYSLFNGFVHMAAGLCVGLTGLAAGWTIGIVGDMGVRSYMLQPRIFVSMVLGELLIFAEVLGLYGLIVGLILNTKGTSDC